MKPRLCRQPNHAASLDRAHSLHGAKRAKTTTRRERPRPSSPLPRPRTGSRHRGGGRTATEMHQRKERKLVFRLEEAPLPAARSLPTYFATTCVLRFPRGHRGHRHHRRTCPLSSRAHTGALERGGRWWREGAWPRPYGPPVAVRHNVFTVVRHAPAGD